MYNILYVKTHFTCLPHKKGFYYRFAIEATRSLLFYQMQVIIKLN